MLGREIATLVNDQLNGGEREVVWNASKVPSGVYMYRLNVDGKTESKRMLLLK
jgi:hypothetical protein